MKLRCALLLVVLSAAVVCAQVGWEAETRIEVYRVNPKTKKFLQIVVRDDIPATPSNAKLDKMEGMPSSGCTAADIFGAGSKANVWAWTVDGVQTGGDHPAALGDSSSLANFYSMSWKKMAEEYDKKNPSAKLAASGACNTANVAKVNTFIKNKWDKDVQAAIGHFKSQYTGPKSLTPAPVIVKWRKFGIYKIKDKEYCHRDEMWHGYEAPTTLQVRNHDYGYTAILELKTKAATGAPLNAGTLNDHRTGFSKIRSCILKDEAGGIITIEVSADEHWILKVPKGVQKFKREKDTQFTFNGKVGALKSLGDIPNGWPDPPVTTGMSAEQKDLQSYLLKLVKQFQTEDKNNMSPYVKQEDYHNPVTKLKTTDPFKASVTNIGSKDPWAWMKDGANTAKLDDFMKECKKEAGTHDNLGSIICAAAYEKVDDDAGRDFTDKSGKKYVTLEERIPCNSAICKFAFTTGGDDAATTLGKYGDKLG